MVVALNLHPLTPEVSPLHSPNGSGWLTRGNPQDVPSPDTPEFNQFLDNCFAMGEKLIESMEWVSLC